MKTIDECIRLVNWFDITLFNDEKKDAEFQQSIFKHLQSHKRLVAALEYILILAGKKDIHLGHPRLTDKECIYCMTYFALNNGACGYTIDEESYRKLIKEINK